MFYKRVTTNQTDDSFIAIKQNRNAFGISGKDSDGKFFWLTISREKLRDVRDLINHVLILAEEEEISDSSLSKMSTNI